MLRSHKNVIFFGHVDAGKSTVCGHLLYLLGLIDPRELAKVTEKAKELGHASWLYAYLMDSSDEERARGKTIEVGTARFDSKLSHYTILDSPGHLNYVANMISAASLADLGVLVVSARKGEFETGIGHGSTLEHTRLARACGVRSLVVAVNKLDSVEDPAARYAEIVASLRASLKPMGFLEVVFVAISGYQGTNLVSGPAPFEGYRGPSLVGALDSVANADRRDPNGPFRFSVLSTEGDLVTGKVESGSLRSGDLVTAYPSGQVLEVSDFEGVAGPRAFVTFRLRNLEGAPKVLGTATQVPVVSVFEAKLAVDSPLLAEGAHLVMHIGPHVEDVSIKKIVSVTSPGGEPRKAKFARKGDTVRVGIATSRPVALERFADHGSLGRFVLRDGSSLVAIGQVMATARTAN